MNFHIIASQGVGKRGGRGDYGDSHIAEMLPWPYEHTNQITIYAFMKALLEF